LKTSHKTRKKDLKGQVVVDKAGSSPGLGPDTTTLTSCEPTLPASSDRASLPGEERTLAAQHLRSDNYGARKFASNECCFACGFPVKSQFQPQAE
ncbi:hypothetical protein, partial [Stutzerimonas stutzeri]|uniref:hypothetical protein n=1 Tax=Stutzerimonas stutzeri TaxID=316 RepID=UPI001F225497